MLGNHFDLLSYGFGWEVDSFNRALDGCLRTGKQRMDSWLDGVGVVLVNHALALPQASHSRPNYAKIVSLHSLSDNCLNIYFISLVLHLLPPNLALQVKLGIYREFISIKIMITKYSTAQYSTVLCRSAGSPNDGDPCTPHTAGHLLLGHIPRAEVNLGMT